MLPEKTNAVLSKMLWIIILREKSSKTRNGFDSFPPGCADFTRTYASKCRTFVTSRTYRVNGLCLSYRTSLLIVTTALLYIGAIVLAELMPTHNRGDQLMQKVACRIHMYWFKTLRAVSGVTYLQARGVCTMSVWLFNRTRYAGPCDANNLGNRLLL